MNTVTASTSNNKSPDLLSLVVGAVSTAACLYHLYRQPNGTSSDPAKTNHDVKQQRQRQKDDSIYAGAVPHGIQGYYTSFQAAATLLRVARPELDPTVELVEGSLDAFYEALNAVETALVHSQKRPKVVKQQQSFVVVVEGLDGSGKSTLVQTLAKLLPNANACSTPTTSMADVRPVFDKRGGPIARAYYMVSNYFLQHELRLEYGNENDDNYNRIFVVDRWFSSTCAYSIAWKNTSGGPESIDALQKHDPSLFIWPSDLDPPNLMILLDLDDETRKQRVSARAMDNNAEDYNPWDERLSQDENLGKRILRAHQRLVVGPQCTKVMLDASQRKEDVAQEAIDLMTEHVQKHFDPLQYFKRKPLRFFQWASSQLGLCHDDGRRAYHASWACQIALNSHDDGISCPSLRSVGIHTVDDAGILFFTWGHPGGGRGGREDCASLICVIGEYPFEQQWRAEGVLVRATLNECELLNKMPPQSLVSQIQACSMTAKQETDKNDTTRTLRMTRNESHNEQVAECRQTPLPLSEQQAFMAATRFVPLRMEVLMGGPSSPQGPNRYEWVRNNGYKNDLVDCNGWSEARAIAPFSPPNAIAAPFPTKTVRPVTLAIMGTHCAGKKTLGERVATIMGWQFHQELGDVLRDKDNLVPYGHTIGDGTGGDTARSRRNWDDYLYNEECNRDEINKSSRVVETWHVGNLAWALQRRNESDQQVLPEEDKKRLIKKSQEAIKAENSDRSSVLFVQLEIEPETTLRRRKKDIDNATRLPMLDGDDKDECYRLHQCLQIRSSRELLPDFVEDLKIPLLVLGNDSDGEDAIEESARKIVGFICQYHWRRLR